MADSSVPPVIRDAWRFTSTRPTLSSVATSGIGTSGVGAYPGS
jgi:hypothetical protein